MSIENHHHVEWLGGFMREVSQLVETVFDEMGSVWPTCWFVTAEGVEHRMFDGANNDVAKDAFAASLRKHFEEHGVVCYAYVGPSRMKQVHVSKGGVTPFVPPPDAIEVLTILVEDRQRTITGFRKIIRPVTPQL